MRAGQLMLIFALVPFSFSSYAMPVDISWSNADKYRDLRSVVEKKTAFQHRFFKAIHGHLNELSTNLPHGYKLSVDVTQVDLAGRIELVNGQQVRVVKDIHYPNMSLSYKLSDAKGEVVQANKAQIRGKSFLMHRKSSDSYESFPYEKRMLTRWYQKEFATIVK